MFSRLTKMLFLTSLISAYSFLFCPRGRDEVDSVWEDLGRRCIIHLDIVHNESAGDGALRIAMDEHEFLTKVAFKNEYLNKVIGDCYKALEVVYKSFASIEKCWTDSRNFVSYNQCLNRAVGEVFEFCINAEKLAEACEVLEIMTAKTINKATRELLLDRLSAISVDSQRAISKTQDYLKALFRPRMLKRLKESERVAIELKQEDVEKQLKTHFAGHPGMAFCFSDLTSER